MDINDTLENDKESDKYHNTEQYTFIQNKLIEILDKINNIEKTYVSINSDLIAQNIKMSEMLNGKLKEPEFEMPKNEGNGNGNGSINDSDSESSTGKSIKELYYFEKNGQFIVHGPGTYDNRPILKQYGEWDSFNKTWNLIVEKETLLEKLPNIIEKSK